MPRNVKNIEMSKNRDYTTGNVLDYLYHQINYELIGINLSRETNTSTPHQINFIGKLEEDDFCNDVFYGWKVAKNYSKVYFGLINRNRII